MCVGVKVSVKGGFGGDSVCAQGGDVRLAVKASVKVKVILGGEDKESQRDVWN